MTKEHCEWSLVARLHAKRKDGLVGKVVTNTLPSGDECPGIFAFLRLSLSPFYIIADGGAEAAMLFLFFFFPAL